MARSKITLKANPAGPVRLCPWVTSVEMDHTLWFQRNTCPRYQPTTFYRQHIRTGSNTEVACMHVEGGSRAMTVAAPGRPCDLESFFRAYPRDASNSSLLAKAVRKLAISRASCAALRAIVPA